MLSKLFLATVATIGLLLAGPQKASAQVVHACVSSAANSPIIIEPTADAPCPPSAGGQTWTKISWNASAAQPTGTTNLLFQFVIDNNRFDTQILISNTSADPFNTVNQAGTCTLSYYSSGATPATKVTSSIPAGTSIIVTASTIQANAIGYVFASCNFAYAHGLAFLDDQTNRTFSVYPALVVQTPRVNGENLNN